MPDAGTLSPVGDRPLLVLRALGLGDLLTGIPALRGLRRAVAPRPVLLAAAPAVASWLVELDVVDGFVPTVGLDGPAPGRDLGEHDAVDLHGNGAPSRDLLAAARPGLLASYAEPATAGLVWDPAEHEVRRWCRLAAAIGAPCDPRDLYLPDDDPPLDQQPRPVVLHPGAASGSRRWPADRWSAVARALSRNGQHVLVTAGPGEEELAGRVAQDAGLPRSHVVSGLALPQLVALVRRAALLLCGDTGLAHVATAVATPSVLLFGPTAPSVWGPSVDHDLHPVIWHGDGRGDPHGETPDPHLLMIEVDEVLSLAQQQQLVRR